MTNNPNSSAFSGIEISPENSYFRSNWSDPNDPFESALSSIVSSPASGPGFISGDGIMIKELIGRLGSIYHSGPISPQSCIAINGDSGLAERAANFSSFGGQMGIRNRSEMNSQFDVNSGVCEKKFRNRNGELMEDSREGSSVSEQNTVGGKTHNGVSSKKRKSIPKAKINESSLPSSPVNDHKGEEKEVSNTKRSKTEKKKMSSENCNNKVSEKAEPSKDYIHVRARRGQATDSHSLAERVRREKISDRMKFLQDLVPGCNKVTGKATVLDEIINYVQSLQQQVEFLSMKLANVNPRMDFNMEIPLSNDMFEVSRSTQSFPFGSQQMVPTWINSIPNGSEIPFSLNPLNATGMHQSPTVHLASVAEFFDPMTQVTTLWGDDLQSIVQTGTLSNAQMKVEL